MNVGRLALLGGVLAFVAGILAMVDPALLSLVNSRYLVWAIGAIVLLQALRVLNTHRHRDRSESLSIEPELPLAMPPPGDNFEQELTPFLDTQRFYTYEARIQSGLRQAAQTVLTQFGGHPESRTTEQLAAGTWTDDPYAAAFLDGERDPDVSLRTQLRRLISKNDTFERNVRHTVDAIAAIAGVPRSQNEDVNGSDAAVAPTTPSRQTTTRFSTIRVAPNTERTDRDPGLRATRSTGHWHGVGIVALIGIGLGIIIEQPAVVLAGVVGIGYAAYAHAGAFSPGSASIERSVSDDAPAPGEEVTITVTVRNNSDRVLPDLRIIDGVPEVLAVTRGTPRHGTALRPGEETTFSYAVTARRGVHSFSPALLLARDVAGATEQEWLILAATTLTCVPPLQPLVVPVPLREHATQNVGRVETSSGGHGIEFFATREYRTGDPLNRIDWNRRARTGELSTIEFREERAATVVIVIDAREPAYVAPRAGPPHAVDRAVDAAGQLFATLISSGDRVGLAALSAESCWLSPRTGTDHQLAAQELLATNTALSPVPSQSPVVLLRWRRQLRERLPAGTQVLFLTPLCDAYSPRFAREIDEYGYPVTVISLDPTTDRTAGTRFAQVNRRLRIASLRRTGIPVVEWPWDEELDLALARAAEWRSG